MKIRVNGQIIEAPDGSNISVVNGVVTIGDTKLTSGQLEGLTKLVIEGNCGNVTTTYASVEVKGGVSGSVDAGGSITCGNVGKNVDAGGSVTCNDVTGKVDAGGSVKCGKVMGDVDAGGSVRHG